MYLTWRAPAAMALCVLAVFVLPYVWFVWAWAVLVLLAVALDVAAAPSPAVLRFQREPLGSVHLGDSTTSVLIITNTGRRRVKGAVRDSWLPGAGPGSAAGADSTAMTLEPGDTGRLEVALRPPRRGFRRTDQVCVRSRGPLGLAGRQRSLSVPGGVQVMPAFPSRRALPGHLLQLREIEGNSQVRTFGRGSEFDSLREYVRGDDVRSIDWRATARHRLPVVRTWRPERDRRVVIVLDTSRLAAGRLGNTVRLDAGMDACLLLAALASHAGDTITWLAGDRTLQAQVNAERAAPPAVVGRLLHAMAPIEPRLVEPDWRMLLHRVREAGRRGALVVLVTPFDPASIEEGLLAHLPDLAGDHRIVIASVADPEISDMQKQRTNAAEVYAAAAAERVTTRTEELRDVVERLGISVLHLDAEHLPSALADEYLRLKREGRL